MSLNGYEQLPLESQRRLDDACTRLERDWAGPSLDRLAERLEVAPPEECDVWLTELLHIEVERARRAGISLLVDDYLARFPAFPTVIEAVFAEYSKPLGVGDSVGKYRLTRLIGRGASGMVFEAEDAVIGRQVAVKLLTGPAAASRTVQEARIVGRLQHPNIVTIYDAGSADGVWYIAMELLATSTADRLKGEGPFTPEEATRIVADVCRGLAAAHAAGLIHRDIKPANILLSPAGASIQPIAKLSDFGLARAAHDGKEIDVAGTPLYMAPEQFDGREAGPACDIYSLGATHFALLTGHPPYQSTDAKELREAHKTKPPPTVITASGEVLSAHTKVIARAMAKSPDDRYSSADEMLTDLASLSPRRRVPVKRARRFAAIGIMAMLIAAIVFALPGPTEWIESAIYAKERQNVSNPIDPTWTPLLNAHDLGGWKSESDREMSVVMDDGPVVHIGGDSVESIMTEGEYENYHLRMEIRWHQPGQPFSGGLRYHITSTGDSGGWDEFSLMPVTVGKHQHSADRAVRVAALRDGRLVSPLNGLPKDPVVDLSSTGRSWHRIDLVCWNELIVHGVNGNVVSTRVRPKRATGQGPTRGRVEVRATRGSIDVRRIEIRSVAGIPTELQGRDG